MKTKTKWPKPSKRDTLRAAQAAYYALKSPFLSDLEFDWLEAEYEKESGRSLPVGSDSKLDYTETEWALALYFCLVKMYDTVKAKPKPMAANFKLVPIEEKPSPSPVEPTPLWKSKMKKRRPKQGLLELD